MLLEVCLSSPHQSLRSSAIRRTELSFWSKTPSFDGCFWLVADISQDMGLGRLQGYHRAVLRGRRPFFTADTHRCHHGWTCLDRCFIIPLMAEFVN